MEKSVIVHYPDLQSNGLKINYKIDNSGELHTITCSVAKKGTFPSWLQLSSFIFESMRVKKDKYSLLFNRNKFSKNLDTVLFLDEVYASIMQNESLKWS